jgi:hypothetical protein
MPNDHLAGLFCRDHSVLRRSSGAVNLATAVYQLLSFAAFACCLAGLRIDEMRRSARKAGNAYKDIVGFFGFAVALREPLHLEARIWTAEDEWRH